ncbi:hypothetical protein RB195_005715 [Necator americanus]
MPLPPLPQPSSKGHRRERSHHCRCERLRKDFDVWSQVHVQHKWLLLRFFKILLQDCGCLHSVGWPNYSYLKDFVKINHKE